MIYPNRKYYWWRSWEGSPWEPVSIRINAVGEEIVFFLGKGNWSFKSVVGGEFGREILR